MLNNIRNCQYINVHTIQQAKAQQFCVCSPLFLDLKCVNPVQSTLQYTNCCVCNNNRREMSTAWLAKVSAPGSEGPDQLNTQIRLNLCKGAVGTHIHCTQVSIVSNMLMYCFPGLVSYINTFPVLPLYIDIIDEYFSDRFFFSILYLKILFCFHRFVKF